MDTIDEMKHVLTCVKHMCRCMTTCEHCLMWNVCNKDVLICPESWDEDDIERLMMKEE